MVEPARPSAFMSYAHFDDEYHHGKLTALQTRLSNAVRALTGRRFDIFQDRKSIAWGQAWQERIEGSLDEVTFFIPILSPNYFKSQSCRDELERFARREQGLGRRDRILPIYWIQCDEVERRAVRAGDPLAELIVARQYDDWRELRHKPIHSEETEKRIELLAEQIRRAMRSRRPGQVVSEPSGAMPTGLPTLIVDCARGDGHRTIAAALAAAAPGTRVLVRPGLYEEELVIDKNLELVGDAEAPGAVVVQSSGASTLLSRATSARVANLVLRQLGDGDCYAVESGAGCLELEGCDITSRGAACVLLHDAADPLLRDNRIHDGGGYGVLVSSGATGMLERNEIFSNAGAGIGIGHHGDPTLRDNTIRDNRKSGVAVFEGGRGTLEGNKILGNAYAGVLVSGEGAPTVLKNRIGGNGWQAIAVFDRGRGTFEGNDLRANTLGAWDIAPGHAAQVQRTANRE
jgi:parallel beta-helix repeat protein